MTICPYLQQEVQWTGQYADTYVVTCRYIAHRAVPCTYLLLIKNSMNDILLLTTNVVDGIPIEWYYGLITANQVAIYKLQF